MPARRPADEVDEVLRLVAKGVAHADSSRLTRVPVSTLRNWIYGRIPRTETGCSRCGSENHDFLESASRDYSYLLAVYLGDGYLCHQSGRTYSLRVALDSAWPGIVAEVGRTITKVRGRGPWIGGRPGQNVVYLISYWKQWPCCFPQHGSGRKHERRIELDDWQREIVRAEPEQFLRGLIHTDGWRGLNRVHVKGRDYAYPRYQFSNRSDDIRRLFTDACDQLEIAWRPWTRYHISVARRDAVVKLDEFIGPKT